MREGKRKSVITYLAAGVLLTCFLAQAIDCYRLKKSERRREWRNDADTAKTTGLQQGKIVFGRVFENGSGLESQGVDGTRKSSAIASVEDETTYQADFAGWSKGQARDTSSREASWKRMAPSLQCGWDQMKFRAVGPGASQFAVEQGNASPMPLSRVPSTCGYSIQRNSLALVMLVPYDGCSVFQEGGSYILPMLWQGIPVSLWCPKPAAPAPTTADPLPVPQTPSYPPSYPQMPQNIKNPGIIPPYLPYPQYPSVVVPAPTTAATTTTTTTTTKKPEMPNFPQYPSFPFPPFYPYFPPPLPITTAAPTTTAATTTTTTANPATTTTTTANPASAAPPPVFPPPLYPPFFIPFPWPLPGPLPTIAQTTTTQTTMTKPTAIPQFPFAFPPFFPQYPPFFPPVITPYPQYTTSKPETTMTTQTTTSPTTKKTDSIVNPAPSHYRSHFFPHVRLPFPYIPYVPPYYTPSP